MAHFYMRLIPPRPTFPFDMTPDERALMGQHAEYTRGFYEAGKVLAYGPVLDPTGAFGVALLDMADMDEVDRFAQGDPTYRAGLNTYTAAPMMIAGSQASRT